MHRLAEWSGVVCVVIGLFFLWHGASLVRDERRAPHALRPRPFSGRETQIQGVALVALGVTNVFGGWSTYLIIPVIAVMLYLAVRLAIRGTQALRRSRH
jgi:hypothetical protein